LTKSALPLAKAPENAYIATSYTGEHNWWFHGRGCKMLFKEHFFRDIFNTVHEGILILDEDIRVLSANRSFFDIFKVNPEDTIGSLLYDLGNGQWNIPHLRTLIQEVLLQNTIVNNFEIEHNFQGIGQKTMLLNARKIMKRKNSAPIIFLAIEDITERKAIEAERKRLDEALSESQHLLRLVFDTIPVRIFWKDKDLNYLGCNHMFATDAGLDTTEAVVGLTDLEMVWKEQAKLYRDDDWAVISSGTAKLNFEEYQTTPEGRLIWLRTSKIPLLDAEGKIKGVLGTYEDITERREVENALKKAHGVLKKQAAELKRTCQAKSEFLSNMSHELRTPLNSINGFSEILYDETYGPLNEKQKKYVNHVSTSGKHLLLLINQILDMAKVEAGKMNLELSNFPLKNLLNEMLLLLADMVSKKKLQMLLEIAEDLPVIEADELKIRQIIYNLLSNAIKFTPKGGKIGMRAKKTDSEIVIVVWDTGAGIAPENMEIIFEGFFRVDTPYSRITEGTGLGLPLSRKLVELHGGRLSVESEGLNKGTSIRFTLPLIQQGGAK
jgi:two-component system CheB/CheR fusion protein